jgi:hypothetical protein
MSQAAIVKPIAAAMAIMAKSLLDRSFAAAKPVMFFMFPPNKV